MTGLEKITTKIIGAAELEASRIKAEADAECRSIREAAMRSAEEECRQVSEESSQKCIDVIEAAKSSAKVTRQKTLAGARVESVDRAFALARDEVRAFPHAKYSDLLVALLLKTLTEYLNDEAAKKELFSDTPEVERYEIILNPSDREEYGAELTESLRRRVVGRVDPAIIERVTLSDETADIDGGIKMRFGEVEYDSSLSVIFEAMREELEVKVSSILFDGGKR